AKIGHVLILRQTVDRLLNDAFVTPEDRPVAGQQEGGVVAQDALQRADEGGDIRAVMGVDDTDAAVLVDVVPTEEKIPHLEAQLSFRVAGGVPYFELLILDREDIALVQFLFDLAGRHRDLDLLSLDGGKGEDLVTRFDRANTLGVSGSPGLEQLLGPAEA